MTREEIILLAEQAGIEFQAIGDDRPRKIATLGSRPIEELERFAALVAEQVVAPYREDAERLDFLARAGDVSIGVVVDAEHDGDYFVVHDIGDTGYAPTLRGAIDAARGKA